MLLKVKGLGVNPDLRIHEFDQKRRPKHLSPLGETTWPEWVKGVIVERFHAIGVEDPLRQKLVEPFALAFGGRNNDGAYDLARVDWQKVVHYFTWEASTWGIDSDEKEAAHQALNAKMKAKWGGAFNHQVVYSDGKAWY
jgi:hypothetical protein